MRPEVGGRPAPRVRRWSGLPAPGHPRCLLPISRNADHTGTTTSGSATDRGLPPMLPGYRRRHANNVTPPMLPGRPMIRRRCAGPGLGPPLVQGRPSHHGQLCRSSPPQPVERHVGRAPGACIPVAVGQLFVNVQCDVQAVGRPHGGGRPLRRVTDLQRDPTTVTSLPTPLVQAGQLGRAASIGISPPGPRGPAGRLPRRGLQDRFSGSAGPLQHPRAVSYVAAHWPPSQLPSHPRPPGDRTA